ncbi:FecR family protein [Azorhizophilus paspali]|uniref:FecR domain-containing protein n=1 Tax=Azorhizophilus paspali TaxID=69963 RepID=A0ABV6SR26_AZOPA
MKPPRLSSEEIAAIEWLALQRSGRMSDAERRRFEGWLAENERHRGAWERLQRRLDSAFAGIAKQPTDLARKTLLNVGSSRRQALRGALALAGLGLGGFSLTRPGMPLDGLVADLSTATGERRRFVLADGSSVLLNAQSRVDIDYDEQRRRLYLRRGALLAEVTADARRPFVVETPFGRVQALGTRFSIALGERETTVWVQEAQVRLESRSGDSLVLVAGEGARFDPDGCQRLEAQRRNEFAWQDGWLELHDRPLKALIAALRPYHRGHLRLSQNAADLRISGLFPLDDSEQVLASLEEILPLRIHRYLGWWTSIERS